MRDPIRQCTECGTPLDPRTGLVDEISVLGHEENRMYYPDAPRYKIAPPEFGACPSCRTVFSGGVVDKSWLNGPAGEMIREAIKIRALEKEHASTTRARDVAASNLAAAQRRGDARGDLDSVEWKAAVGRYEDTLRQVEAELARLRGTMVEQASTPAARAERRPSALKRATRAVAR